MTSRRKPSLKRKGKPAYEKPIQRADKLDKKDPRKGIKSHKWSAKPKPGNAKEQRKSGSY